MAEPVSSLLQTLAQRRADCQAHYEHLQAFNRRYLDDGRHTVDMPVNVGPAPFLATIPVEVEKDGDTIKLPEDYDETQLFRALWSGEKVRTINQRADLERQREDLYERMKGYTSAFARQKADKEMDELSGRIDAMNDELERHDEAFSEAASDLHDLAARIREAQRELAGDDQRRQTEAVRKVIGRIVCHHRKNPGATSQRPSTTLERVEIWPEGADDPVSVSCGHGDTSGPRRTGRGP